METHVDVRTRIGRAAPKHHKATLFAGDRLMLGLNCLEPGQVQPVHTHANQEKFYYVVEGRGAFTVGGEEVADAPPGTAVWAPAGEAHGVANRGKETLVLLVGIAPPPNPSG